MQHDGGHVRPVAGRIVDVVGYGSTASYFEGAPAPTLTNSTSASAGRTTAGSTPTTTPTDFAAGTPTPRNSGTVAPPPEPDPVARTIAEVQGAGATSPGTTT